MKRIAVVTTSRADFGILRPVLRELRATDGLQLQLIVSGTHLSDEHGHTVDGILDEGFEVDARVECLQQSDDPASIARAMGHATTAMADVLLDLDPDALVVLGDRFEMHALAVAATPFPIPIAHIHGGEVTEGAIDDSFRHSLTKLAHLHFCSTPEYRDRVLQLGEEAWRVVVSGAPALDDVEDVKRLSRPEFETEFGVDLQPGTLLVTLHPVTRDFENAAQHARELVAALEDVGAPALITAANADTYGSQINEILREFATSREDVWFVKSLGTVGYFSALEHCAAMVGNSSSGIIEAASFGLPVVNIGVRQKGRARGANVIDSTHDARAIATGIRRALSDAFQATAAEVQNPYRADQPAAKVIVDALREALERPDVWSKRFVDQERP